MSPSLRHGQVIFASPYFGNLSPGDVVIIHHDGIEKVKRVEKIRTNMLFVVGDNLAKSTDSRQFGWINHSRAIARVVWPRDL